MSLFFPWTKALYEVRYMNGSLDLRRARHSRREASLFAVPVGTVLLPKERHVGPCLSVPSNASFNHSPPLRAPASDCDAPLVLAIQRRQTPSCSLTIFATTGPAITSP